MGSSLSSHDGKIRLALVGPKGSGKSSFVNAIREGHVSVQTAQIDVDVSERHDYTYPTNPRLIFCDLPGYSEKNHPNLANFWDTYNLEQFDGLLIFTKDEMTDFDRALAKKVKGYDKKRISVIRACMDIYINKGKVEKETPRKEDSTQNTKNTTTVKEIKSLNDYLEQTRVNMAKDWSCKKEDIFLINNKDTNQLDFFLLAVSIMQSVLHFQTNKTSDFNEEYFAAERRQILNGGVLGIEELLKKRLDGWKEVKIRFAVAGISGAGKSSFINTIRGVDDDSETSAKVRVVETTSEVVEYELPRNPNILLCDLPGIGTPNYPDLQTFSRTIDFEKYHIFLIFCSSRFTCTVMDMVRKVKSLGKSFFLIRTKIDHDFQAEARYEATFNEEEVLEKIRKYCEYYVKDLISSEDKIFLISNRHPEKWDFDRLIKAMSDSLPVLQRESLVLSLTNVTLGCLERKAEFFKAEAVAVAALSERSKTHSIPEKEVSVNLQLIHDTVNSYYESFGFNNFTSENLEIMDEGKREVVKRYKLTSPSQLSKLMAETKVSLVNGPQAVSRYIPFIGRAIAGSASFAFTLRFLQNSIDEMKSVTVAVWIKEKKQFINDGSKKTTEKKENKENATDFSMMAKTAK